MNGTCIECLPQKVEGEDELYVFTFFTDISVNNETIDLVQTIHYNIKNTLTNMQRYLNRWKKYRSIWKVDKVSFVDCSSSFSLQLELIKSKGLPVLGNEIYVYTNLDYSMYIVNFGSF